MKSPWKYLAQFIAQRRSVETSEDSIASDPDSVKSKNAAQQSLGVPSETTEASGGIEQGRGPPAELETPTSSQNEHEAGVLAVTVPDDIEEIQAPAGRQTIRSTARSYARRVESESNKKSPQTALTKKLERGKSTDAVAQSAPVAARDRAPRASSSRDAFFEEVANLDEEIKQLRIQLARKLLLQNDQLKKMLERFDVS